MDNLDSRGSVIGARGACDLYLCAMGADQIYCWQIFVLRHEVQRLGTVEAPDSVSAIEAAIKELDVTERERHKLFARRMD
jgi:hypothetical protein